MSDSEVTHCRLCADLKPKNKLVNLQTDEARREKVMAKLVRLSLDVNFQCPDDGLSKSVCFPCMNSLDMAFDFVINVEASQIKLNTHLTDNLKEEVIVSEHSNDAIEYSYEITLKKESDSDEEVTNRPLSKSSTIQKPCQSWKDFTWLCAYCDTMFSNIDELKVHSVKYHGCCNPYRCPDCKIRKLNLDSYIKHVKRHRNDLKLSCYRCHKTFTRQCNTIKHQKSHLDTKFSCPGCNETFLTLKASIEHSNMYSKDIKRREIPIEQLTDDYTCVICSKKFKDKPGLRQHLLVHSERKRDHICEKCGKSFLNKANLAIHMMMHDGNLPYQCEICKHGYPTLAKLRTHISTHSEEKPFSCEECGRLFKRQSQLKSHKIIHTDSLPFVCSYCQKSFRFKTILDQHIRQHTGEKPYKCEVCERAFTNWPNYNKHMKNKHNMNMAKRKVTPIGLVHINPATGDVDLQPETDKIAEWKKKVLENSNRRGRPKNK